MQFSSIRDLHAPPEPFIPPVKEPGREPEDPHAPVQEPEPDPVRPAQI
jgi:hypothetical protein